MGPRSLMEGMQQRNGKIKRKYSTSISAKKPNLKKANQKAFKLKQTVLLLLSLRTVMLLNI